MANDEARRTGRIRRGQGQSMVPIRIRGTVEVDLSGETATYRAQSTSQHTMAFEPIVLTKGDGSSGAFSRKVLVGEAIKNKRNVDECLGMTLLYQKKHNKGDCEEGKEWEGLKRIKLTDIKAGEEIQIDLDSSQTAQLIEHVENMYEIAAQGIKPLGVEKAVVSKSDAALIETLKPHLAQSSASRDVVLEMIKQVDPNLIEKAAVAVRHEQHLAALEEFKLHLDALDWDEAQWEAFFARNKWIFGHGLTYRLLTEVQEQPYYGGKAVDGAGGTRGDHLMASEAERRFTVLVEVKTPQAGLVQDEAYRNRAHAPGDDVVGGVSQVLVNARKWAIDGARAEENRSLEEEQIFTVQPKCILIVGNTRSLNDRDKQISFELYRQSLHNPDLITFDELYHRAEFFVKHELDAYLSDARPSRG